MRLSLGIWPLHRRCDHGTAPRIVLGMLAVLTIGVTGCQSAKPIATRRLIEHQALIDFSGLKPADSIDSLRLSGNVPQTWNREGPIDTALYNYAQWHSPSGHTAVGAARVHLPLPLSADVMVYLARLEYTKRSDDGRLLARWTDDLGRSWFAAENRLYHVQGYAVAQGFTGWFVYFGYKVRAPLEVSEIGQAARSLDTFVPLTAESKVVKRPQSRPSATTQPAPAQPLRTRLNPDHPL